MTTEDAVTSYRQGIIWVVGMSATAVAGAFLHYDQASGLQLIAKYAFIALVLLFAIAVWAGVNCLFWLFSKTSVEERLKKLDEDYAKDVVSVAEYPQQKEQIQSDITKAKAWRNGYHYTMLWTFAPAILFSVVLLALGIFRTTITLSEKVRDRSSDCPNEPCQRMRFAVVQSAIHKTPHGREAHTFLLDQEKGALWRMTCEQGLVEFQRVKTTDLSGEPEDPSQQGSSK